MTDSGWPEVGYMSNLFEGEVPSDSHVSSVLTQRKLKMVKWQMERMGEG